MRKINLLTISLLLLFITSGCSKKNTLIEFTELQLPASLPLDYTIIVDSLPFRYVSHVIVKDSLIIVQGGGYDSFFTIYNKNNYKKIRDFYNIGKGPGEGISPGKMTHIGENKYLIKETNIRKWVYADMTKLLNFENDWCHELKMSFPQDKNVLLMDFYLHDKGNQFIVDSPYGENERFKKICIGEGDQKEDVNLYRSYPVVLDDTYEYNKVVFLYGPLIGISPDRTKLVSITTIGAIAETFQLEQDTMKLIAQKGFLKPEVLKDPDKDNIWLHNANDAVDGFASLITTNDYIYSIYSGVHYENELSRKRIVALDWNLNPVKVYQTTENISLIQIVKDNETENVYGVIRDKNTKECKLVQFNEKFAI